MLRKIVYGNAIIIVLTVAFVLVAPRTIEIRIDCGDLRYKYFGIPLRYHRMTEPARSQLIAVSRGSKVLAPIWVSVVPPRISYDYAGAYTDWYEEIATWEKVDKTMCRLFLEELGGQLKKAAGKRFVVPAWRALRLNPDDRSNPPAWSTDPAVIEYCQSRGYILPTPAPHTP